jgi:hypothetical protein
VPASSSCPTSRAGSCRYAASDRLREHLINARRAPGKFGVSIRKDGRESRHKIDLAVCLVGARMLWRHVQLARIDTKKPRTNQACSSERRYGVALKPRRCRRRRPQHLGRPADSGSTSA